MKDAKHTPGPWGTDNYDSEPYINTDGGETNIAMCFDLRDGRQKANARLIAAAPELLEAAKRVSRLCAEWHIKEGISADAFAYTQNVIDMLSDTIAKAEGRAE